ncbi:hypothetical protein U9M48_005336 [Paspalum notatum var. saurae]|uniref:Strictosidine synthase conserved region domain-containing protein n=1 Tax=Paspalum notatum var. saurae TaxID=547442 RepID=A0AAQ3SLD2_PASNO
MKTAAGLLVALVAAAAAALFVSLDSRRGGVPVLEIHGGGRLDLVPVDAAALGPESLAFVDAGGEGDGPYTGVSDGRVLRWLPAERRWAEHSSSCAPEL